MSNGDGNGQRHRRGERQRSPDGMALVARKAAQRLSELTGRKAEFVSHIERSDEGWRLTVEVVELERIPDTTSVLGSYEVLADDDGHLLEYARSRRYLRNQSDQWEA